MMKYALAATLVAGAAIPAQAATVVPVSAVASSQYPTYEAPFSIDGSKTTDWASLSQGVGSSILLNLGGLYDLKSVNLFDRTTSGGDNGSFVGGVGDFTTAFTLTYYNAANAVIGTQSFTKATPTAPTSLADFAFTGSVNTGPIKVGSVLYTVTAANGSNPGLADISFTGSVPEPATWALMILGFGAIGGSMRYRRKSTAVSFA